MKIYIFEVERWEQKAFEEIDIKHDVTYISTPLTKDNIQDYCDAEIISTFIYSELGEDILKLLPNLKLIATRSTGFDHIDRKYCSKQGVLITNVPSYGKNTVAEHVFGLLLMISHRLVEATDRTRRGEFSNQGLQGFDLMDKTIGVIGTGQIGRHVIDIAHGFSMKVIAHDSKPDAKLAKEKGFEYLALPQLLQNSDIITLHVPLDAETFHMLAANEFAQMRDGTIIINTARGDIIEVSALLHALTTGKVAAAGLDVLPCEPIIREEAELLRHIFTKSHEMDTLLADQVLLRMRNVIITPHNAFNTVEAAQRIIDETVKNLQCFLKGSPTNII